jgi:hypothetical protein
MRVYIAGPITPTGKGNPVVEWAANTQRGVGVAALLVKKGFAVFCPMLDYLYGMIYWGAPLTAEDFYRNSLEMMEACEVIFVLPGPDSVGVKKELERAAELGIPAVYSVDELERLRDETMQRGLAPDVHGVHGEPRSSNAFPCSKRYQCAVYCSWKASLAE